MQEGRRRGSERHSGQVLGVGLGAETVVIPTANYMIKPLSYSRLALTSGADFVCMLQA